MRPAGKTVALLLEFLARGKKGDAVIYKTPEGDFLSPEAVKRKLAAQRKRILGSFKEGDLYITIRTKRKGKLLQSELIVTEEDFEMSDGKVLDLSARTVAAEICKQLGKNLKLT